ERDDRGQALRVETDRAGRQTDVPLKAAVANIGGHESVGVAGRIYLSDRRCLEKGREIRQAHLFKRFLDGGNLFVRPAIARTRPGEMLRDRRNAAIRALMYSPDKRTPHLAHPERIAAEYPGSQVSANLGTGVSHNVETRTEEHIESQCRHLATQDRPYDLGVLRRPGRPNRHL